MASVIAASTANIEFLESCTPGYFNNEGQPDLESFRRNSPYSPGVMAFSRLLDVWRSNGKLAGVEFD